MTLIFWSLLEGRSWLEEKSISVAVVLRWLRCMASFGSLIPEHWYALVKLHFHHLEIPLLIDVRRVLKHILIRDDRWLEWSLYRSHCWVLILSFIILLHLLLMMMMAIVSLLVWNGAASIQLCR